MCTATPAGAPHHSASQAVAYPGGLLSIAHELAAKGDHSAAIPLFRHEATSTGSPEAITGLAGSLAALGQHDRAETLLEGLVLRSAMTVQGWYVLGKSRIALGKYEGALQALDSVGDTAAQGAALSARINSARGIALAALGQTGEAIATLKNESDPSSLGNLALIFATTGNPEAAVNILEPLARSGKASPQNRQNLAMAYLLAGRDEDAHQMARLDLDPVSVNETFTFYRSLASLPVNHRMQALTTGVINPDWTREQAGNRVLADSETARAGAKRIAADTTNMPETPALAKAPEPAPRQTAQREERKPVDTAKYELTEIPPLVEPNGWALQIGAYRTIKALMRGWTILYRANADLLAEIPPRRSEVDFGDSTGKPRGFYYRLNAGPLKSLSAARTLCRELQARGTACWVRPPEKTEGTLPTAETTPEQASAGTHDNTQAPTTDAASARNIE